MVNKSSSASVVNIANDGDVILVVGRDERRLRVSSASLANASKVFNRMFSSHYSEGQNLGNTSGGPKEVHMPEDNADAMNIVCSMIHFRAVPDNVEYDLVLLIAVTADKFDCRVVLQHTSGLWLNPRNSNDPIQLAHLMAASYLLDNPRDFSQITLAMAFRHAESYLVLAEQDVGLDPSVLLRICCLLEELRSLLRTELAQVLFQGATINGSDDRSCSCAWQSRCSLAYIEMLREEELEPRRLHGVSLTHILDRVDKMNDPQFAANHQRTQCEYRWHPNSKYRAARAYGIDLIKAKDGLCIDCVHRSATGIVRSCRLNHQ